MIHRTINELHENYMTRVWAEEYKTLTAEQKLETKRTFFAGFLSAMAEIHTIAQGGDEAFNTSMDRYKREVDGFLVAIDLGAA